MQAAPPDHTGLPVTELLRSIVDAAPDGVLAVSDDRSVLAFNQRFLDLWHLSQSDVQVGGRSPALGAAQREQIVDLEAFETAIARGNANPTEIVAIEVDLFDGRVIEGYAAPLFDERGTYVGRVWYQRDVTRRRAREDERTALLEQLAATDNAHRFLLGAAQTLVQVSGYAETLQSLAQVAVPVLGDLCLIDVVDEHGEIVRMAAHHADPRWRARVAQLFRWAPARDGDHPSAQVIRDGVSRWSNEMGDAFLQATTRDREHYEVLKELEFKGFMCVPLRVDGRVLGAVTVVSAGSGRRLGQPDVALAEALAGHIAVVVGKERRHERERLISHTLQTSLLPSVVPADLGLQVAARYLPGTEDAEVGGDFWDIVRMPSGVVALTVGDVFGHDMIAAATMAQLRSVCRVLRTQTRDSAELIGLLQANWGHLGFERFATAVFARVGPSTGRLRVASAGHLPPVVVQADRSFFVPVRPVPPLGVPADGPASSWEGVLEEGASLVLYTDGLVEGRRRTIDQGMDRLLATAAANHELGPKALVEAILEGMREDRRDDDIAVVVVRR